VSGQKRDSATFGAIMKKRMTDPEGKTLSSSVEETNGSAPSRSEMFPTPAMTSDRGSGDPLVPFNTRLSPLIYRELKLFCVEHDVKQQVVIADALKEYFLARKKV
jgi:hypothetical protein